MLMLDVVETVNGWKVWDNWICPATRPIRQLESKPDSLQALAEMVYGEGLRYGNWALKLRYLSGERVLVDRYRRYLYELGDTGELRTRYHGVQKVTLVSITEFAAFYPTDASWYSDETKVVYGADGSSVKNPIRSIDAAVRQANYEAAVESYRQHLSQYEVWAQRFAEAPDYPVFARPISATRQISFFAGWDNHKESSNARDVY